MDDWLLAGFGAFFSFASIGANVWLLRTRLTARQRVDVKIAIGCYALAAAAFIATMFIHDYVVLTHVLPAVLVVTWAITFNRLGTKLVDKLQHMRETKVRDKVL